MNQTQILIAGAGRLSHHLRHYLNSKSISWELWSRADSPASLLEMAARSSLACLAVKDDAIEAVAARLPAALPKIHFSGLFYHPEILGVHPLMTFGPDLLAPEIYARIPLIVDGETSVTAWLRTQENPVFPIEGAKKPLYHCLSHLAGNYSKFLWEEISQTFEKKLGLPRRILGPYLEQVLVQVMSGQSDVQGGPFGRKDEKTISAHLESLKDFPHLKPAYEQFYKSFQSRGTP